MNSLNSILTTPMVSEIGLGYFFMTLTFSMEPEHIALGIDPIL